MRITIDPITRIEGHLRIDCEVENGKVTNAWSSGQMWRGIELILQGRDPRDAWIFAQRICGVCTTVHAIVSVRAVENALGLEVPPNAQFIRNMIIAAHGVHDHIVHFYQLSALDWVDIHIFGGIIDGLGAYARGTSLLLAAPANGQVQRYLLFFYAGVAILLIAAIYWTIRILSYVGGVLG